MVKEMGRDGDSMGWTGSGRGAGRVWDGMRSER